MEEVGQARFVIAMEDNLVNLMELSLLAVSFALAITGFFFVESHAAFLNDSSTVKIIMGLGFALVLSAIFIALAAIYQFRRRLGYLSDDMQKREKNSSWVYMISFIIILLVLLILAILLVKLGVSKIRFQDS